MIQAVEAERNEVMELITGAWKTRVIGEAVRLGLFDQLDDTPRSAAELARFCACNEDGIMRLLRGLAVIGLARHEPESCFTLTSRGAWLRRDAANSLNGAAGHWAGRMWDSFAAIGESFRTGEASAPSGPEHFALQQADPVGADVFNRAMAEGSLRVGRALAAVYDFSGVRTLRDVGGGYGALLVGPLEANPGLKGEVFDLATLSCVSLAYLASQGVRDRVEFVGGSFFENVPAGADCLMLKFILHDWDDARSLTILRNCAEVLDTGKLLVIERIVPEQVAATDLEVIRGDLTMLTVGGKERTEAEYRALLALAGLRIARIAPIDEVYSVIEAERICAG